jgi:hypothetical protein
VSSYTTAILSGVFATCSSNNSCIVLLSSYALSVAFQSLITCCFSSIVNILISAIDLSGSFLIIDQDADQTLLSLMNEHFKCSSVLEIRFYPDDFGISIWISGYIWDNSLIKDIKYNIYSHSIGKITDLNLDEVANFIEKIYHLKYLY